VRLNVEVNSGAAYIISVVGCIGYALFIKAPFEAFWIAISSLFGWHTGRRLWRQLKLGTLEATNGDTPTEQK
jgi:hypothetical protein